MVIAVSSTTPAYSMAATLGLIVAVVGVVVMFITVRRKVAALEAAP